MLELPMGQRVSPLLCVVNNLSVGLTQKRATVLKIVPLLFIVRSYYITCFGNLSLVPDGVPTETFNWGCLPGEMYIPSAVRFLALWNLQR